MTGLGLASGLWSHQSNRAHQRASGTWLKEPIPAPHRAPRRRGTVSACEQQRQRQFTVDVSVDRAVEDLTDMAPSS